MHYVWSLLNGDNQPTTTNFRRFGKSWFWFAFSIHLLGDWLRCFNHFTPNLALFLNLHDMVDAKHVCFPYVARTLVTHRPNYIVLHWWCLCVPDFSIISFQSSNSRSSWTGPLLSFPRFVLSKTYKTRKLIWSDTRDGLCNLVQPSKNK